VALTDNATILRCTAALTLATVAAASGFGNGFSFIIFADNYDVVFNPYSTETVNGASSITFTAGTWGVVVCEGANWFAYVTSSAAGSETHAAPESALTDADEFGFWDSALAVWSKITYLNLKAALKTYFDGIYTTLAGVLSTVNVWSKGQAGAIVTLTDASPIALDLSLGNNFKVLLTAGVGATRQLANPTNVAAGQSGIIAVTQDATGSRLLTFAGNYVFAGGSSYAPALTLGVGSAVDYLGYYVETPTRIFISASKGVAP
jgi:hypothetical protein